MSDLKPVDTPTLRNHKRQVTWQILVPFSLVTLVLLAAGAWLVWGAAARARVWADVSTIWLIVPVLFFALAALILFIALIVGMAKLLQAAPRYTTRAQQVAGQVADGTRKVADGVRKPFAWLDQAGAAIKSFFKF